LCTDWLTDYGKGWAVGVRCGWLVLGWLIVYGEGFYAACKPGYPGLCAALIIRAWRKRWRGRLLSHGRREDEFVAVRVLMVLGLCWIIDVVEGKEDHVRR
jgi:hypothetical protein